jgi:hypothetical protein
MQTPEITLRIEMFGNLIEELNRWHYLCESDEIEMEINNTTHEYCEQMFIDTLSAVREMREMLLEELNEYRNDCKLNQIPIDLSYVRIEKQLKESTFSLVGRK